MHEDVSRRNYTKKNYIKYNHELNDKSKLLWYSIIIIKKQSWRGKTMSAFVYLNRQNNTQTQAQTSLQFACGFIPCGSDMRRFC